MKYKCWTIGAMTFFLFGCGQPGPLYLPKNKPPVYVPPEKNEDSATEQKTENKAEKTETDKLNQQ